MIQLMAAEAKAQVMKHLLPAGKMLEYDFFSYIPMRVNTGPAGGCGLQ